MAGGVFIGGCQGIIDPEANAALRAGLGDTSFTVFPAFVRGEEGSYNAEAARTVADFLTDEGLGSAAVADDDVPLSGSWGHNQAKMFQESAADFAGYLGEHPIASEYALLPEYLMGEQGTAVGIHCYILDARGRVAWGQLWNSHHESFAEATLDNPEACTAMLIGQLRALLTPTDADG